MIGDSIFIELGDLVVFVLRDIHLVGIQCCIYEGGYIFVVLVGILYRF